MVSLVNLEVLLVQSPPDRLRNSWYTYEIYENNSIVYSSKPVIFSDKAPSISPKRNLKIEGYQNLPKVGQVWFQERKAEKIHEDGGVSLLKEIDKERLGRGRGEKEKQEEARGRKLKGVTRT